jgi:hypothetical protein
LKDLPSLLRNEDAPIDAFFLPEVRLGQKESQEETQFQEELETGQFPLQPTDDELVPIHTNCRGLAALT